MKKDCARMSQPSPVVLTQPCDIPSLSSSNSADFRPLVVACQDITLDSANHIYSQLPLDSITAYHVPQVVHGGTNSKKGVCSVCKFAFSLTKAGKLYPHGGRVKDKKCEGTGKFPFIPDSQLRIPTISHDFVTSSQQAQALVDQSSTDPLQLTKLWDSLSLGITTINHIPKGARQCCRESLAVVLERVARSPNDPLPWADLLAFAPMVLYKPSRGVGLGNLTKTIKARATSFTGISDSMDHLSSHRSFRKQKDPEGDLAKLVSAKIESGNFSAAVRIACSDEVLAPVSAETIASLTAKHPVAASDRRSFPDLVTDSLVISNSGVIKSVNSFPNGSAAGLDGLKPQHLKDLLGLAPSSDDTLLLAIVKVANLLLDGVCSPEIQPFLFGGNLTALIKKDGGIRPIAVGCLWRRLVAKCANTYASAQISAYLTPKQLGVGVKGGVEAAVHAARRFISNLEAGDVMAKIDFTNAFNTIRRDSMLEAVRYSLPSIYNFCKLSYGSNSWLNFKGTKIISQEGCQQGDPLGPLLFSVAIHSIVLSLSSDLVLGYLDDLTLGGPSETVAEDVNIVEALGSEMGLTLNRAKCEIFHADSNGAAAAASIDADTNHNAFLGFKALPPCDADLLGAPLAVGSHMDLVLGKKVTDLSRATNRLAKIQAHDGLVILQHATGAPNLTHILRASPCADNPALLEFDNVLRQSLSRISNCALSDKAWLQATLPVSRGGLGIRSVSRLAPSAFLASAAATSVLQSMLLPSSFCIPDPEVSRVTALWSAKCAGQPQQLPTIIRQATLVEQVDCKVMADISLSCTDQKDQARWLACQNKCSGEWLKAIPITSCGLRLDDEAIRIAIGLRLGTNLCIPHPCPCGAAVDVSGVHGLSCRRNQGRLPRHSSFNDIVHRALIRAGVPSTKEPVGLFRTDGKRPDGATFVPWQSGKCLAWDATAPDTLAASYLRDTSVTAGSAAEFAASRKVVKYNEIIRSHFFVPLAIESLGPINSEGLKFLHEIGRRLTRISGDPRETTFLLQRISIANQRYNATAILGCLPSQI